MRLPKPTLPFWQILNMNFGFFGLQYSFGLQQANMSPIYSYLGAEESKLPFLWLAGPVTGLIIQPIVGAMSDKTVTKWGRRTPYFLVGAIFCSLCLFIMPYSSAVWMAASILWILDAANNITQEPYRAFVSDKLNPEQHSIGFLTQSAFTGLGQTLSYLTPTLLIAFGVSEFARNESGIPITTIIAFIIGSVMSISSILWTLKTTKEIPLTPEEITEIKKSPKGLGATFAEISEAFKEMPSTMKQMIPMMFFSWYAMFIYWIYIPKCLSKSLFNTVDATDPGFRKAELLVGQIGAFYNTIAFVSAFGLAALARKYGAKIVHSICLSLAGIGLLAIPMVDSPAMVFIPIIGMGVSWASMMGNPYVMLAGSIPPQRTGVYMGIFNMFIVIPMMLQNLTMPLYYESLLGNNPINAIRQAGIFLILGAISVYFIKVKKVEGTVQPMMAGGH
jgi:maltose/moltooligosaccharide transporter